jgi:hypothetical protein
MNWEKQVLLEKLLLSFCPLVGFWLLEKATAVGSQAKGTLSLTHGIDQKY